MNRLILGVTAIGVSVLAVYAVATSESGEEIPVASVPQRPAGPPPVLLAMPQPINKVMPSDFPSLAREIQRELRRVGCYRGEINGLWTPSTRAAMKAFVDDANAVLPVDQPDQVLLSLLQGESGTACGSTCPPGQQATSDGACSASTVASTSATVTGSIDRELATTSGAAQGENGRAAVIQAAPERQPPDARRPDDRVAPAVAPNREPLETAALDDPQPPMDTAIVPPPTDLRPKSKHARYGNRPPKFVRSLFRNIKRSLAPFGIR